MAYNSLRDSYDVIVLGLGPGGGEVAERLAEAGLQVLGVDPHLVGGECPYYGCIPSKMIVRAAETLAEAGHVNALAGVANTMPDFSVVAARIRTEATDDWNDQVAVDRLENLGGHFVRAAGQLAGRDEQGRARVQIGDRRVAATKAVVVATGTAPAVPPIPGLADLIGEGLDPAGPVWTNREVLRIRRLPRSLIVLGGGAVGTELAQGLGRFGVRIIQLEGGQRILGPEEPEASRVIASVLDREGIELHTSVSISSIGPDPAGVSVRLADGRSFVAERLLLAAGRRQHIPELAVDTVGLDPRARNLDVDEHMKVAEGIYAVGDVTGRGAFTHVAVWQARVLIAHLLGRPEPFGGYHGLAWVTFTDPEVGRTGLSERQARDSGLRVGVGRAEISASTRGWIHGAGNEGFVKVVADRNRGVLVGATVVAASGGEILGMLTLAVHAAVPLEALASMHYAYPTLHRTIGDAIRDLG